MSQLELFYLPAILLWVIFALEPVDALSLKSAAAVLLEVHRDELYQSVSVVNLFNREICFLFSSTEL